MRKGATEIVLALQKQEAYRDLRLLLAILFPEFADRFPPKQRERYQRILEGCADSVIVCRAYRPDAYKKRNYYMVDHSACGIAVYDNDRSIRNGTGMTANYAKKRNALLVLIHPDKVALYSFRWMSIAETKAAGDTNLLESAVAKDFKSDNLSATSKKQEYPA